MSSTAPPTTPARKNTVTRSFTSPTANINRNRAASNAGAAIGETEGVETLFVHPNTKVIRFTSSSRPGSSAGTPSPGGRGQGQGMLPWATPTEKTMAMGPLEIYRVPGSVSFLHSGALLHTIMPRSNCWCVDGVSKFAMRVLPDTYYRIELPGETPADLEKVEELKVTFAKVLFYERTACPFARGFSVDLPEEEEVKPRKRRRRTDGPAKKWKLDKAYSWKPEGWTPDQDRPSDESSGSQTSTDEEGSSGSTDDQADEAADQVKDLKITTPTRPSVRDRAKGFNLRSVTAPPNMSLQSTPPSRLRTSFLADDNAAVSEPSRDTSTSRSSDAHTEAGASQEERRTLQAIPTHMPPSPPDSSAGFDIASPNPTLSTAFPEEADSEKIRTDDLHTRSHIAQAPEQTPERATASSASTTSPSQKEAEGPAAITRSAARSDQLDEKPRDPSEQQDQNDEAECPPILPEPRHVPEIAPASTHFREEFVKGGPVTVTDAADVAESGIPMHAQHELNVPPSQEPFANDAIAIASLPTSQFDGVDLDQTDKEPSLQEKQAADVDNQDSSLLYTEQPPATEPEEEIAFLQHRESASAESFASATTADEPVSEPEPAEPEHDPYAQIQARIQARRTIGVTTGFEPLRRQTTRQSSSSTASSSSLKSKRSRPVVQDQALAAGLVRKAYDTFLGPPAHLIAIMLKIAARFARGTFRNTLLYESPDGMKKTVPGSFDLDESDLEDELDDGGSEGEDDFGVPLRSPIRMLSSTGSEGGLPKQLISPSIKERRGWLVETET